MAKTYEPIATYTATTNVSSFDFTSISGTYTDLVIVASLKNNTGAGYNLYMRFNSDSGSNYSTTELYGTGSAAGSGRGSNQTIAQAIKSDNSNFSTSVVSIQNYSNSTTYKTLISRTNPSSATSAYVTLWRSTAAITSINFSAESPSSIVSGSTVTLYGIKAA